MTTSKLLWGFGLCIAVLAIIAIAGFDPGHAAHVVSGHDLPTMIAEGAAGGAAADILKKFEAHHGEITEALKSSGMKHDEVAARLTELEQKAVRKGGPAHTSDSWGAQIERNPGLKALNSGWKGRERFAVKATITSATADADGSAGDLVMPDRRTTPIEMARRKLKIRSLFAPGRTGSNMIQWPKQTGRTIGAAAVAEGGTKPQSDLRFQMGNWPVTTLAHWVIASRQILDDAPALGSLIDSELRYGLDFVEENQLLNGAGTGTDLVGVYYGATAFSAPFASVNPTEIDVLLQAIAQVDATDYDADGIVINPLDWRRMQALKDTADRYLGGGPFGDLVQRLWQMPIVTSKAMTVRKFLVGAFQAGAQIFDREDANVELSTEDGDNFRKNLVTVLGEKRLAFVVKHADVFVKGDFDDALAVGA